MSELSLVLVSLCLLFRIPAVHRQCAKYANYYDTVKKFTFKYGGQDLTELASLAMMTSHTLKTHQKNDKFRSFLRIFEDVF